MDYSKLKNAALQGAEDEEAVTVDTRALIDKVLARYSGEWTTLRELIQNAADAQATSVTIRWETLPSVQIATPSPATSTPSEVLKHVISNHTIRRLVVRNNGQPFTKTDWGRIKRIAEGNPDETKIGAFGVGFYSVFADCEEPFISSGSEAMAFYWKGNALFTKKSRLPDSHNTKDTMFVLDYRNTTMALPNLLSICQFLATSLTFVALEKVEFWIDDWKILGLHKKSSPSIEIPIPHDLQRRTQQKLMELSRLDQTSTQIDATTMSVVGWKKPAPTTVNAQSEGSGAQAERPSLRSFFKKFQVAASQTSLKTWVQSEESILQETISEDVTQTYNSTIFLRVASASIATHVPSDFAVELERATKKPPPRTTRISILTSSYDELTASVNSTSQNPIAKAADVFASVLPSQKPGGRIFIGFPTMQTSGGGMHISAPSVIPTVEREAIDLNARWVRLWNVELLRASGIMSRLAFSQEMEDLGKKVQNAVGGTGKTTPAIVAKYLPEALHILSTFAFTDSTPSSQVSQIIEEAFWTCFNRASIEMYSSKGVLPTTKVRIAFDSELEAFVADIPVIPKSMNDILFVKKLAEFGLISGISHVDIRQELESKALTKDQAILFIKWLAKQIQVGDLELKDGQALLSVAVCSLGDAEKGGKIISLGAVNHFLNPAQIPAKLPLPPSTIPYELTSSCQDRDLRSIGWEVLDVVSWLRFLMEPRNGLEKSQTMTASPEFASMVLGVLSKCWDNLGRDSKDTVVSLLSGKTVMPTKMGLRNPTDSFFSSVKLFDDLPIVQGEYKHKFLLALGVRKTLDLETIFKRLLNPVNESTDTKWSHVELIKYLASVKDDIPRDDMTRLKASRFCTAEVPPKSASEPNNAEKGKPAVKTGSRLYKVSDLYNPQDSLRELGFPLLQWPDGALRSGSDEHRFLSLLGLQACPQATILVDMMCSEDEETRAKARRYFIVHHTVNGYQATNLALFPRGILPIMGDSKRLVRPADCYTNERASIMGFEILSRELRDHASKFGVAADPPIMDCIKKLIMAPPTDKTTATAVFEYFASRLGDIDSRSVGVLKTAAFIPVFSKSKVSGLGFGKPSAKDIVYVTPQRCYLGTSVTYGEIFDFVSFSRDADAFLFKCGVKSEPTKREIAEMVCSEPARLLGILQTSERYLSLLKTLAEPAVLHDIKRDKELWKRMKASSMCLASKELVSDKNNKVEDNLLDEDAPPPMKQYQLDVAKNIIINDDIISYRIFKEHLTCAPEDEMLEDFYLSLGAHKLSSLVQEEIRIGPEISNTQLAATFKARVVERSKIFLHQYAKFQSDIKHDWRWLENSLTVVVVQSLSLRRVFKGVTNTSKRTAASLEQGNRAFLYLSNNEKSDMFQVGQALCRLLLSRPSLQADTTFEPILSLNLYDLRARGYDVDRILRAKAEKARIAEEARQKALEEEQKRIQESREHWETQGKAAEAARQAIAAPSSPTTTTKMPGSFDPSSPESTHNTVAAPVPQNNMNKKKGDFFSNFTRRLGFNTEEEGEEREPHTNPQGTDTATRAPDPLSVKNKDPEQPDKDDGRVTNPAIVRGNLLNAINATRPFGTNTYFSAPRVNEVKEQATYCDSTSGKNIVFAAEASNGMRVFLSRDSGMSQENFVAGNSEAINAFAGLLQDLAGIYQVALSSLHVFYDEAGGTIAFNTGGSVFFNLRFFLQLHYQQAPALRGAQRAEAGVWWWVVMAHELAHNLVQPHNSDHSYYTESFIQQYHAKIVAKTAEWTAAPTSAPPPYNG